MIKFLRALYLIVIIQLIGCATADLSGFSDQTTALMVSVSNESQAIADKMNDLISLAELAEAEKWFKEPILLGEDFDTEDDVKALAGIHTVATYTILRNDFGDRTDEIGETLDAIAAYSTSLAELAAAGETGREAVQKSVGTLDGIATTLGGPAGLIGDTAVSIVKEIALLVTRAQAQNRIEDAMEILAGPDGALRQTVVILQQMLDILANKFVNPTFNLTNVLERYRHGPGLIAFYNGSDSWLDRNRAYHLLAMDNEARKEHLQDATEEDMYIGLLACLDDKPGCPHASLAAGLAAQLTLLSEIQNEFEAYEAAKRSNDEWRNRRISSIAQIKRALDAWADQHDSIYDSLSACGGFKALKPGCGNWSEANLREAVEKVESILSDSTSNGPSAEGGSS